MMSASSNRMRKCMCELTLWRVRVVFVPPWLCSRLDPTSFHLANYCRRQQQHVRRYSREVPDFNQIWVCGQIFILVPNMKFHPKPSSGCRADTCGQTDRRKGGRFSRLRERAYKRCILSVSLFFLCQLPLVTST